MSFVSAARHLPTALASLTAIGVLPEAGRAGAWLAFDVIGPLYGLETLAGLAATVMLSLAAALLAAVSARAVAPRRRPRAQNSPNNASRTSVRTIEIAIDLAQPSLLEKKRNIVSPGVTLDASSCGAAEPAVGPHRRSRSAGSGPA